MYERSLVRNLERIKEHAGVSLFSDFFSAWFGYNLSDCLIFLHGLVYPVIDSNGAFCIFLYLVSQFQAWNLSLPQYIVKGRRTDTELLCYATLLFLTILYPFSEFIHRISLFFIIFCIIPRGKTQEFCIDERNTIDLY